MQTAKVLLAVPTYDGKIYCQDNWLEQVKSLTYKNLDVLIIDNSKSLNNFEYLKEQTRDNANIEILYCKPSGSVKSSLNDCMQIIREKFLDGNYTHLFSLETDVFCPVNTIEYLLCFDLAFVGLPYFHGSGTRGTFLMSQDFVSAVDNRMSDIMIPQKAFLITDGNLFKCYQGGIGCTLIQRWVIEAIPFRVAEKPANWFPDGFFHDDCKRKNIHYYIATDIFAQHFNNGERWTKVQKERNAY